MAYGYARMAPVREKCDNNVIVLPVANICVAAPAVRKEHMEYLKGWGQLAPLVWRPNVWTRTGKWGLPEVSIPPQAENFKLLAESNGVGVIFDTVWENWATFAPQYYLMAQLTWDPRLDADALMKEYYQRAFGPAADLVKQYWTGMETLMDNPLGQPVGLTDPFLAKSERLLAMAEKEVATGPEIYRDRVAFVRSGLTFTHLMLDCLKARKRVVEEQVKEPNDRNPAADAQLTAAWNELQEWVKRHPGAVNHRYLRDAIGSVNIASKRATRLYFEHLSNLLNGAATGSDAKNEGKAVDLDLPTGEF